jgi:hypothetical protein
MTAGVSKPPLGASDSPERGLYIMEIESPAIHCLHVHRLAPYSGLKLKGRKDGEGFMQAAFFGRMDLIDTMELEMCDETIR